MLKNQMNNFKTEVLKFVKQIPKGKVVSYGFVASMCGKPRGAREVGWILRNLNLPKHTIPWWRVVNSKGEISIKGNPAVSKHTQSDLLKKDGVLLSREFKIDMQKYGFSNKK